jgi:hypothetical protein
MSTKKIAPTVGDLREARPVDVAASTPRSRPISIFGGARRPLLHRVVVDQPRSSTPY